MEGMMRCDDCKFAEWNRTSNGRLHPDKTGKCKRLDAHPLDLRLPAAFYWIGAPPRPSGGFIDRKSELKEPCAFKAGQP
jgi:hypothetical protein